MNFSSSKAGGWPTRFHHRVKRKCVLLSLEDTPITLGLCSIQGRVCNRQHSWPQQLLIHWWLSGCGLCVTFNAGINMQPDRAWHYSYLWFILLRICLFPKYDELQFHFSCYNICLFVSVVSSLIYSRGEWSFNRGQFIYTIINCSNQ